MAVFSLIINVVLFFLIFNLGYLKNKKANPNYPNKPFAQLVVFPLILGILFTLIVDVFKGILFYQLIIFIIVAIILYCVFYKMKP